MAENEIIENRRLRLQAALREILGSSHVYFQPPSSIKLEYPCIVYSRDGGQSSHADDTTWKFTRRYKIQCISKDPDNDLQEKVLYRFSMAKPEAHYVVDNLYHDNVSLYY